MVCIFVTILDSVQLKDKEEPEPEQLYVYGYKMEKVFGYLFCGTCVSSLTQKPYMHAYADFIMSLNQFDQ